MGANSPVVVPSLEELERREAELLVMVASAARDYAGLSNLDHVLGLVECRLQIALAILQLLATTGEPAPQLHARAREAAQAAIAMLDELLASGVSDDQRSAISDHPAYVAAKQTLERLIVAGGGSLLEPESLPVAKARLVSSVIAAALRAHAAPDDRYHQLIRPENMPRWLRTPVRLLFSVIAPEYQAEPPYGIEEGDEEQLTAERIRLPLSQAILFLREEVLALLREQLAETPGDAELQARIADTEHYITQLERLRFIPRPTPLVIEHGYYTNAIGGYTADGELLVSVPLAVSYRSGTNLDRVRDMVKQQVARRLAGRGVSETLDQNYRHLRSLQSGLRGSSRTPSLKLDAHRAFIQLKREIPMLRRIDTTDGLRQLLEMAGRSRRRVLQAAIEAMLADPRTALPDR